MRFDAGAFVLGAFSPGGVLVWGRFGQGAFLFGVFCRLLLAISVSFKIDLYYGLCKEQVLSRSTGHDGEILLLLSA